MLSLGKALRDVEKQIKDVEKERLYLMLEKYKLVTEIKNVLNTVLENPLERELIATFFYKTVESLEKGLNIKQFLEDIYLKLSGSRAGVKLSENIPEYIIKQQDRIVLLEELLQNIIRGLKFIKTEIDTETSEEFIFFDLD